MTDPQPDWRMIAIASITGFLMFISGLTYALFWQWQGAWVEIAATRELRETITQQVLLTLNVHDHGKLLEQRVAELDKKKANRKPVGGR